jgi:hypothetical protein
MSPPVCLTRDMTDSIPVRTILRPGTRNDAPKTFSSPSSNNWTPVQGSCPDVLIRLPAAEFTPARIHHQEGWLENAGASIVLSQWPNRLAVPVGLVSQGYQLLPHRTLIEHLLGVLVGQGVSTDGVTLHAHLTPRGERLLGQLVIMDPDYQVCPDGHTCALSVFLRNAVDGRGGLDVRLGWYRLVCTNGMIIGKTVARYRSPHRPGLDLGELKGVVAGELLRMKAGRDELEIWAKRSASPGRWNAWADKTVASKWGPTAATRVLHVLREGTDPGDITLVPRIPPSLQRIKGDGERVPGAPAPAVSVYDCYQALTWVATRSGGPSQRDERTRQAYRLMLPLLRN